MKLVDNRSAHTVTSEELRRHAPKDIVQAGEMFEALFVEQVFKELRQNASTGSNPFSLENGATKIYQSMKDSDMAEKIAKKGDLGIADLFIESVMRERYNNRQVALRGNRTGVREGNHEGKYTANTPYQRVENNRGSPASQNEALRVDKSQRSGREPSDPGVDPE